MPGLPHEKHRATQWNWQVFSTGPAPLHPQLHDCVLGQPSKNQQGAPDHANKQGPNGEEAMLPQLCPVEQHGNDDPKEGGHHGDELHGDDLGKKVHLPCRLPAGLVQIFLKGQSYHSELMIYYQQPLSPGNEQKLPLANML